MATSSFALKQLQKYGWKEGQGLGPAKDGLAKPLTVSVKNNTHGLGSVSTEWSSTWWDHVFNKAASKIQIDKTEDDVRFASD